MKFFDYSIIPEDEYKAVIITNANHIKSHLGQNAHDFFQYLINEHDRVKILTKLEQYLLKENVLEELEIATITLYNCMNGNLVSVCSAYGINQGHLGDADENNVYDIVRKDALGMLAEYAE